MTDRELLEAAARAAGMESKWDQPRGAKTGTLRARQPGSGDVFPYWMPLHDDGDALRLAVQCGIEVSIATDEPDFEGRTSRACAGYSTAADPRVRYVFEDHGGDLFAATRRAIVRAAAAIAAKGTP
jgi:hypothetical protein